MNTRTLIVITLVGISAVAATGVVAATTDSATASETTTVEADTTSSTPDPANYTRLYIDDGYRNLELKPGKSETVTVTVENGEDEAVDISPRIATPPTRSQPPVESDWVSIDGGETTLDAGESVEVDITVDVPDDAEIGDYSGVVAFTDETIRYPGRPPQPVHSVSVSVNVWEEPTVQLNSETHIYTHLQAGETISREIEVSNTGEEAVPVNPQFNAENQRRHRPADRTTLDRSWVTIDAPSEIAPGETGTIELTVEPPADAERGDYSATVDLGLTDPARNADNTYWQEIGLNFQVWTAPEEPFETSFSVSEATTNATLELTANQRQRAAERNQDASFDVTFVAPDGREIDADRASLTDSGSVNLGAQRPRETTDDTYAARGSQQTFTYEIADPAAGDWSVRIMPQNTIDFSYEISRDEAN